MLLARTGSALAQAAGTLAIAVLSGICTVPVA